MYSKAFYITENIGNNSFSFGDRKNPRLYVPHLTKIQNFNEIKILEKSSEYITFEEYDFNDVMQACYGFENLYEIEWKGKKMYLVDNHNHVFYFWYLAREQGILTDDTLLYHVDEHADTRDPGEYLLKPNSRDLEKVFQYTNFFLNVGNYIVPAEKEGLIGDTIQVRSADALESYNSGEFQKLETQNKKIILNLDLDFFEPELDFIDYALKKQVILDIAHKADLITVCSSPYFIDQQRALEVFKDIFDNN